MIRTIVRALACALTLVAAFAALSTTAAVANPGDPPQAWNTTTGWDSLSPGPFQHNWDEAAVGDGMQAQSNDWAQAASYTSSWQRCLDTAGNGCVTISGATTTSYTLNGSDVGKTIRFCSQASSGGTMCTSPTKAVVQAHANADGDGYEDYRDSCYQQTGALPGGCPDYAQQPTVTNSTTGGDADSELAAGDVLEGDPSTWAGGDAPYTYEWRRCVDQWCRYGSELVSATTETRYTVWYQDYGYSIQFCAIDSGGVRMCSKGAGPLGVRPSHTDTDKDGVADYKDKCASSPALTEDGCPVPAPAASAASPVTAPEAGGAAESTPSAPAAAPSPQANGAGADRAAQLTAVINNRSRTLKVRFGKKATINGRLVDSAGKAIANAELVVLTKRNVAAAQFSKVTAIRTDGNGRFRYIAPAGASRVVRMGYFAFSGDTAYADATDVTLLVAGALTLKAPKRVANKRTAAFSGKVKGRPLPAAGVLVDLQVRFRGKWRTFATPRTNAKGAFRFKYRFTQGAAKWTFRARVRKDSLYPYELAYSRKVAVRVTG